MLRRLAMELLRRQPATFADLVNGEIGGVVANQPQPEEPRPEEPRPEEPRPEEPRPEDPQPEDPQPGQPGNETPNWCNCGLCRVMPTQEENKCCCAAKMPCITMQPLFAQLVLDGNVLDIALRLWEDVLVHENNRNNENFWHAAYRQFVLWQHGRLGKGNRRVIPSCCVLAIRSRYPSPNGLYVGYRPSRL